MQDSDRSVAMLTPDLNKMLSRRANKMFRGVVSKEESAPELENKDG